MKRAPGSAPLSDSELGDRIAAGARALELKLADQQVRTFVAYVRLIERWNRTYNLTAVRDPADMVTQHVLDCLAAAAALARRLKGDMGRRLLDVGSGAGLPGLVFAATFPELEVACIDSVGKKAAFLRQAAATLLLPRVRALHGRVEELQGETLRRDRQPRVRIAPGLPERDAALDCIRRNMDGSERKGPCQRVEGTATESFHVEPLQVPGLQAERCVVWIEDAEK